MLKKHTQTKCQQTRRSVQTNTRRQTQEHKSSINERYKKKQNKKQTLTLRIEESKYGRVVTVMQQQVLGSSSGRGLEAALCHRFCLQPRQQEKTHHSRVAIAERDEAQNGHRTLSAPIAVHNALREGGPTRGKWMNLAPQLGIHPPPIASPIVMN
jgi:hypothetical protein